jgi:MOSC domain-containing protein YiiM
VTHTLDTDLTVQAIHIAPGRRLPMKSVDRVVAEAELGLVGDRYHGHRERHVSIQSATQLAAAAEILGRPIEPRGTRRNFTISGGEIPYQRGSRINIGSVQLEVFRMAAPCRLLDDEIGPGAAQALRRRAGSVCRVLEGGTIGLGDHVDLEAPARPVDTNQGQEASVKLENNKPADGDPVAPESIPGALTAGPFRFDDGATQVFTADGETSYSEHGRASRGTWYVEGQSFCSFWPPSYTGCYDLSWLVEAGEITGLRFIDQRDRKQFVGRYQR